MEFRYFKRNIHRQFILYSILVLSLLFLYDAIVVNHSVLETIIAITSGAISILCLTYQYCNAVMIDEKGIKHSSLFREYTLSWDMIGQVKVIPRWNGKAIWIIILKSKDPKHLYFKRNITNRYMECITFPLDSEALTEIAKYRGKQDYFDKKLHSNHMYKKLGKF